MMDMEGFKAEDERLEKAWKEVEKASEKADKAFKACEHAARLSAQFDASRS